MLQHIGTQHHVKLFVLQARMPVWVFQIGLQGFFAKWLAHGQCFGVHFYAGDLTSLAVQNAGDSAWPCAQFQNFLARLNQTRQSRGSTAPVGIYFVSVAMFYHGRKLELPSDYNKHELFG